MKPSNLYILILSAILVSPREVFAELAPQDKDAQNGQASAATVNASPTPDASVLPKQGAQNPSSISKPRTTLLASLLSQVKLIPVDNGGLLSNNFMNPNVTHTFNSRASAVNNTDSSSGGKSQSTSQGNTAAGNTGFSNSGAAPTTNQGNDASSSAGPSSGVTTSGSAQGNRAVTTPTTSQGNSTAGSTNLSTGGNTVTAGHQNTVTPPNSNPSTAGNTVQTTPSSASSNKPTSNRNVTSSNPLSPNQIPQRRETSDFATRSGLQALQDAVHRNAIFDSLNATHVAALYQEGIMVKGPDGRTYHEFSTIYRDKTDPTKLVYTTASRAVDQANSFQWSQTNMGFNTAIPSHYTDATATAFYSTGKPTYWATTFQNTKGNAFGDKLTSLYTNGNPVLTQGTNNYVTTFPNRTTTINGQTLLSTVNGVATQLPGTKFATTSPLTKTSTLSNGVETDRYKFADGTVLVEASDFFTSNGQMVTAASLPQTGSLAYLQGQYWQDAFTYNSMKGSVGNISSVNFMQQTGLLSLRSDADAANLIQGRGLRGPSF